MDIISQLKNQKFWWMDVIFYFTASLLVATLLCYLIFVLKIAAQKIEIRQIEESLETVGTDQQKQHEQEVILLQKKISDFAQLFKNHGFSSQAFVFMEGQTLQDVWFKKFDLSAEESAIKLSGETENNETLGREVASLEKNENVAKIYSFSSTLDESARVSFSMNLSLYPKLFTVSDAFNKIPIAEPVPPILEAVTPSDLPAINNLPQ